MPAPKGTEAEDAAKKLADLEETVGRIKGGYAELGQYIEVLKDISNRYFRLMDLYAKHGSISVDPAAPDIKDPISKEVIRILLDMADKKDGSNLSEITRELKGRRGTASRRIVRDKISELEAMGYVRKIGGEKIVRYSLSDALVEKWYSLLVKGK